MGRLLVAQGATPGRPREERQPMTDRDALLAATLAHPDEDTPRLAFADFLDEQGGKVNQFRAEFIRVQCHLARAEPWSEEWRAANARNAALVGKIPPDWTKHLKG